MERFLLQNVSAKERLEILQNDFKSPYRNHSVCTNQPYMGYKTS